MKFKPGRIILIALCLTLIPVSAVSAQKITAGTTCKGLNQKAVYQNKNYTCIKSGKKFVWNKGVAIKKPAPTPEVINPKVEPTSTNEVSGDNLSGEEVDKW